MSKLKDITGMKYGMLTVISRADDYIHNGRKYVMWNCVCDCGNHKSISASNLMSGRSKSCGCQVGVSASLMKKTHGETDTKLYYVWSSMKSRCYNKNSTGYDYYGKIGITVCDSWRDSYISFRDWANSCGYVDGLTIDRINVYGNYEPDNCRWVTSSAQANNRRSNRLYSYNGETHNVTEWANKFGINPKTLFTRIYSGKDFIEAIEKRN